MLVLQSGVLWRLLIIISNHIHVKSYSPWLSMFFLWLPTDCPEWLHVAPSSYERGNLWMPWRIWVMQRCGQGPIHKCSSLWLEQGNSQDRNIMKQQPMGWLCIRIRWGPKGSSNIHPVTFKFGCMAEILIKKFFLHMSLMFCPPSHFLF